MQIKHFKIQKTINIKEIDILKYKNNLVTLTKSGVTPVIPLTLNLLLCK